MDIFGIQERRRFIIAYKRRLYQKQIHLTTITSKGWR